MEKEIQRVEQESGIQYEEKQRLAITTAVQKGLLILTGGPGTGKTTHAQGILTLFERDGWMLPLPRDGKSSKADV